MSEKNLLQEIDRELFEYYKNNAKMPDCIVMNEKFFILFKHALQEVCLDEISFPLLYKGILIICASINEKYIFGNYKF